MAQVKYSKTQRGAEMVKVTKTAMLAFGGGLYLKATPSGAKSWVARVMVNGKRSNVGLGTLSAVSLELARPAAAEVASQARAGLDPVAEREESAAKAQQEQLTFEAAARLLFEQKVPTWKDGAEGNPARRWWRIVSVHCADLCPMSLTSIRRVHTSEAVKGLWHSKPDTARRVRQVIEAVFRHAQDHGLFEGSVPVASAQGFGEQDEKVRHLKAVPWEQCPALFVTLTNGNSIGSKAAAFALVSGLRGGSVRTLAWSDIDLEHEGGPVATIRPENLKATKKAAKAFRLPLSPAAVELLESVRGLGNELVFPSPMRRKDGTDRALSDNAVTKAVKVATGDPEATLHGLRSSLREWADQREVAFEVAEMCLQHNVDSKVVRAYRRSDLLERRRPVMDAWAQHLTQTSGKIVTLPTARSRA